MGRHIGVARVAASLLSQVTEGEPRSDAHQRRPLHDRLARRTAAAADLCTAISSCCVRSYAQILCAYEPMSHQTSGKPILDVNVCDALLSASAHLPDAHMSTQADKAVQLFSNSYTGTPSSCCHTDETRAEVDEPVTCRLYLQQQLRARRTPRQRASFRQPEAW